MQWVCSKGEEQIKRSPCTANTPGNADRMCLASFVAGLSGVVGRQLRYAHPRTLQVALNLALAVEDAES